MTYKKFPNRMFELVNTGGEIHLGKKRLRSYERGDLDGIRLTMIFYRTDLFTGERFRVRYKPNYATADKWTDWVTPSTYISDFNESNYWVGAVYIPLVSPFRIDPISGVNIDIDYWLEADNYTYAFGATEIGVILDFIEDSETDLYNGRFEVKSDKLAYLSNFIRR